MDNLGFDIQKDYAYKLGVNVGFPAAFLLFASVFFFLMGMLHKVPSKIKYYHVVIFVVFVYLIGMVIIKLKK